MYKYNKISLYYITINEEKEESYDLHIMLSAS